jgi:rare lipoprotein A
MYAMTAASKVLPLPSYVLVRNLRNNRTVIARINDRGPFYPGRIIDLSYAAAVRLGVLATGTAPVEVVGLVPGQAAPPSRAVRVRKAHSGPDVFGRPHNRVAHAIFFVQFGAFARRVDAEHLRAHLRTHGLQHIHVFRGTVNGRRLYMVRIGPLPSKRAAVMASTRAARQGLGPTFVVDP